jgi:hypothetical protein
MRQQEKFIICGGFIMKFKSKIDWWAHIAFATLPISTILCIVSCITIGESRIVAVIAAIFCLLLCIFIMPIWVSTYYVLGENELIVKCGFLKSKVAYGSIKSVKETRNPLASTALSLDRIEIIYGVGGHILISPQNKQEFLQQLEQRRK